jgi:hypothetical protein
MIFNWENATMSGILKKVLIVWLVFSAAGLIGSSVSSVVGQEQEKKFKGRLPAYYADLVTEQQKTQIYSIQARYQAKIAALNEELEALEKKQDSEIENVLTPAQKTMLKKAQEEGAAKRKKTAADKKLAEAEKNAAPVPAKKPVKK